ncbi:hypothetical protein HOE67_01515 [Candidatus Peregrinibacteria bacterium]|jgi:hypothetical protein|nr:hypothetical protein [Candidatus Peregrinibacteria bacterium]MBT4055765.1 hypothetical protein [Candidatus Peregrinibacteria bacterium]
MSKLNTFEQTTLEKPTLALLALSDVFDTGEIPPDFDADLTTLYRHLIVDQSAQYGLKAGSNLEKYAAELINSLIGGVKKEIELAREEGRPDADAELAARKLRSGSTRVILNSAPRTKETKNGGDYYLAITDQGVELYVSTLEHLAYIRDRVQSLFRIPNKDHPAFDGEKEQFRSSIIARSCRFPNHLQRVKDPQAEIPGQANPLEVAYIDKFGNVRLRAQNIGETRHEIERKNGKGTLANGLVVHNDTKKGHLGYAKLVDCLDDVPDGALGLYENVADGTQSSTDPGYLEFVRKWEETRRRFFKPTNAEKTLKAKPGHKVGLYEPAHGQTIMFGGIARDGRIVGKPDKER